MVNIDIICLQIRLPLSSSVNLRWSSAALKLSVYSFLLSPEYQHHGHPPLLNGFPSDFCPHHRSIPAPSAVSRDSSISRITFSHSPLLWVLLNTRPFSKCSTPGFHGTAPSWFPLFSGRLSESFMNSSYIYSLVLFSFISLRISLILVT